MGDFGNCCLRLVHAIDDRVPRFIDAPSLSEFRAQPIYTLIEETAGWIETLNDTARWDFLNGQLAAMCTLSR